MLPLSYDIGQTPLITSTDMAILNNASD